MGKNRDKIYRFLWVAHSSVHLYLKKKQKKHAYPEFILKSLFRPVNVSSRDDADSIVKKQGKTLGKKPIQMSPKVTEYGSLHICMTYKIRNTIV
jgi:hypothetical protein